MHLPVRAYLKDKVVAKKEVAPLVCSVVRNISFDLKKIFLTLIYFISTWEVLTLLSVKSWLSGEVK